MATITSASHPSSKDKAKTSLSASAILAASIERVKGRVINGREAEDLWADICWFEGSDECTSSADRALVKEGYNQLKLHGFRIKQGKNGGFLQYNLMKDTLLPKPARTEEGDLTPQAVVEWYDAFTQGKEMDEDSAWLFTQWSPDMCATPCPRYQELWDKAFEILGWDTHEDDFNQQEDDGPCYSHREEVGVNGGSSFW